MRPNNPFLITGYHSPEYFCDRQQETKALLDALHNERNVTLTAPRRIGKTGLIKHTLFHLKKQAPDVATLYMDIFSTQSLSDFVRLFAHTVLGQLDSAPQKALNRIGKFIKSCRPTLTFDELTGAPKVSVDVAPAQEENTLKEIFDYLSSSEKTAISPSTNSNKSRPTPRKASKRCYGLTSSSCQTFISSLLAAGST